MSKTINEYLNALDVCFQMEREKLKIEQRINLLNNEHIYNENNHKSESNNDIKIEIENLKKLFYEYKDKISIKILN